jgi:pullulanase/glycogen debranching enzyme
MTDHPQLASRGCMPWDSSAWNHELYAYYAALIALRKRTSALQIGSMQEVLEEEDTLAYVRECVNPRKNTSWLWRTAPLPAARQALFPSLRRASRMA